MEDNNQTIEQAVSQQDESIRFISDEEVAQAMSQPEPQAEVAPEPQPELEQPTPEAVAEPQVETQTTEEIIEEPQLDQQQAQQEYAPEEVESAVFGFLSERLGREIKSIDDFQAQQTEQKALDERISVISDFVEKTGRDPRDWFVYQSMNPSEMDDMTAIQVKMASDYPNLSQQEIQTSSV